jgi:ABC-type iron transport system FetAB permease component
VRIFSRIAIAVAIALLTAFAVVVIAAGQGGAGAAVVAFIAIAALVAGGNALYGRHSHGKKAVDRVRPAQEAHDRAADLAAEARRAVAEAERRGERYCPLDPAQRTSTGSSTNSTTSDAPT